MERYFIFIIVVTVISVPTQKKDVPGTNFIDTQRNERIIPTATFESSPDLIDVLAPYTQLRTIAEVIHEKKSYEVIVYRNSIRKMIKNWHSRLDNMPGSANPRVFYNILRSLLLTEPYL